VRQNAAIGERHQMIPLLAIPWPTSSYYESTQHLGANEVVVLGSTMAYGYPLHDIGEAP